MAAPRSPLRRRRDGTYRVQLSGTERDLLKALPGQLEAVLGSDDPADREDDALARLFPRAYQDPEAEASYREMVGAQLLEEHRQALAMLSATAGSEVLDEGQACAWLGALNDLRLVIGTDLDVGPGDDLDADASSDPPRALYQWLTWLQAEVVDALAEGLAEDGDDS